MANEPTRILRLHVQDFRNIIVADITPDPISGVVSVVGKNGGGKSSLLSSIATLIEGIGQATVNGKKPIEPVRKGADVAKISADIGYKNGQKKYVVSREIGRDKRNKLSIKNANGKPLSTSQGFLDDLAGHLGFDMAAFLEMDDAEQFEALRRIAGLGPEIDHLDSANESDREVRKEYNANVRQWRAAADQIVVPEGLPEKRTDVAKQLDLLNQIAAKNREIDKEEIRRVQMVRDKQALLDSATAARAGIDLEVGKIKRRGEEEAARIQRKIDDLTKELADVLERTIKDATLYHEDRSAAAIRDEQRAVAIEQEFNRMEPLPVRESDDRVLEEISAADEVNRAISLREQQQKLYADSEKAEAESKALTAAMECRENKKQDLIAAADIKVPGLGFGPGVILLNGVPFSEASDGQRLMTAAAIAMAVPSEIRVLLVRRASLIDKDNLAAVLALADSLGFQPWLETVGVPEEIEDGTIVMSDGVVVKSA